MQIAIVGAGPSGLFMLKKLLEANLPAAALVIYERKRVVGAGMPYSTEGAGMEHITNVSGNEIPELVMPIIEWMQALTDKELKEFAIDRERISEYKVFPRLLFGKYLSAQFEALLKQAKKQGIKVSLYRNTAITDISDDKEGEKVLLTTDSGNVIKTDRVVICTGHNWPRLHESTVKGYFDSPYPPSKLAFRTNHHVAIRGSSLTAIDAIRTLARSNGNFTRSTNGQLSYLADPESRDFKISIYSKNGLLPAVRFHLKDSHLSPPSLLSRAEIEQHKLANDGFLSLDFIFEQNFKAQVRLADPDFYERIRDMDIETFVGAMMDMRKNIDPFQLLKAEYIEAEQSIRRKESVYWKEMLAVLSFTMNYPAKYFSAEDMLRLQKTLMPLISVVIAFLPQSSVEEMFALYKTGRLAIVAVGEQGMVEAVENGGARFRYVDADGADQEVFAETFVDCIGQPHLSWSQLPFPSLIEKGTLTPAKLRFRDRQLGVLYASEAPEKVWKDDADNYFLKVAGVAINDHFQVTDAYGAGNERVYLMAVPYMGGYNPDYSGLDFCEAASTAIANSLNTGIPSSNEKE